MGYRAGGLPDPVRGIWHVEAYRFPLITIFGVVVSLALLSFLGPTLVAMGRPVLSVASAASAFTRSAAPASGLLSTTKISSEKRSCEGVQDS